MTINDDTGVSPLPARDSQHDRFLRQSAARIVAILPAKDEEARYVLALASELHDSFLAAPAVQS